MPKSEIKVALVGYGGAFNMGKHHTASLEATGRMRTVAVCDVDPARLEMAKEELGPHVEVFPECTQLLKWGKFDLAIVILPHCLHAPVAIKCLKAGKHVITEKPMCVTVKEATAMIDAARQNGMMLSVFHNRRWDGDFLALRQIIESGLIGKVFQVEIFAGGWSAPRGWWRDDKAICGGLAYDWGAHFIYWLLQIVPAPITDVTGFVRKLVWHEMTNEDQVQAIIRFSDGTVADFQQSQIARVGKPRWRILGDRGGILAQNDYWQVNTEVNGLPTEMKVPFLPGEHQKYYENIAAHILDGAKLIVTAEDARRVIGVVEYAGRSAAAGKALKIPYEAE